jgi:hypothetical protein
MSNPIVDLEKLSEPLTKLVDVISKGIGRLYAPFGTIRQARADAEARVILARADAKAIEIRERVQARIEYREALRQENIERIASQAASELPGSVSTKPVDMDWTLQYFDSAQDVCDEDMQKLWARVLAGEVASPGSYSKRTLQFLRTLQKDEAEAFTKICSLAIALDDGWHHILEDKESMKVMRDMFGDGTPVRHFVSIGLLLSEPYYVNPSDITGMTISYFSRTFSLKGPPKDRPSRIPQIEVPIAIRGFTSIGQQLASVAGGAPIEGYVERVAKSLDEEYRVKLQTADQSGDG